MPELSMDNSIVFNDQRQDLRIECIRAIDKVASVREDWDDLAQRCPDAFAFQTFEWALSWWSTFGADAQPLILTVRAGTRLVGLAPLMVLDRGMLGRSRRVIQFMASHYGDFLNILLDPEFPLALEQIMGYLYSLDSEWDLIYMTDVSSESLLVGEAAKWFGGGRFKTVFKPLYVAPTYCVGDPQQDRRILRKQHERRARKALQRAGKMEKITCQTVEEGLGRLEQFFACHVARWENTDTPSEYRDPQQREHMRAVVRLLLPAGYLKIWVLLLDGEPLAFSFVVEFGKKLVLYRLAYDLAYAKLSPGAVLNMMMFEYAITNHLTEVCLGVGDEGYKKRFSNAARQTYEMRIYRRAWSYWIDRLLIAMRDWVRPVMERSRLLRPIGLYVRARWPDLQR